MNSDNLVEPMLGAALRERGWGDGTREHGYRALSRLSGVGFERVRRMFLPIEPGGQGYDHRPDAIEKVARAAGIPLEEFVALAAIDHQVRKFGIQGGSLEVTEETSADVVIEQLGSERASRLAMGILNRTFGRP